MRHIQWRGNTFTQKPHFLTDTRCVCDGFHGKIFALISDGVVSVFGVWQDTRSIVWHRDEQHLLFSLFVCLDVSNSSVWDTVPMIDDRIDPPSILNWAFYVDFLFGVILSFCLVDERVPFITPVCWVDFYSCF